MKFNGITKDFIEVRYNEARPLNPPVDPELIKVVGYEGAYLDRIETGVRELKVPINLYYDNFEDLQKKKEEVTEWLTHDEPKPLIFSDEEDRIYYAIYKDTTFFDEHTRVAIGELQFVCPDPYKYGVEKEVETYDSAFLIENTGTASAQPIFELTATKKSTFAMVALEDDEYNMIGRPAPLGETPESYQELIMHDNCQSTAGWTQADFIDNGEVTGSIKSESGYFTVDGLGEGEGWHGPSIKRNIGATLEEFHFKAEIELLNIGKAGMIEFYFLNSNDDIEFKIGIEDLYESTNETQGKFQIAFPNEPQQDRIMYYVQPEVKTKWNNYKGVLQVFRSNGIVRPYFALVEPNGRHNWVSSSRSYQDMFDSRNVSKIQVALRGYEGAELADMKVKDIKVWRYNPYEGVPYILDEGDILTFDHVTNDILINGESRNDLKNFGGHFFNLKPGKNTITVLPDDGYYTKVRYKERWK